MDMYCLAQFKSYNRSADISADQSDIRKICSCRNAKQLGLFHYLRQFCEHLADDCEVPRQLCERNMRGAGILV